MLPLDRVANKTWTHCPAERVRVGRAVFLDGQLERVESVQGETTRAAEERRVFGGEVEHAATQLFELSDAVVVGGRILVRGACQGCQGIAAVGAMELFRRPAESRRDASIDCTYVGNRYFGHWLTDDVTLHLLARELAPPFGVARAAYPHEAGYGRMMGLTQVRVKSARVNRLIVAQDHGQNADKRARYRRLREALARAVPAPVAAPVFLRRGTTGVPRLLVNESEIERRLVGRGYRVVEAANVSAEELVAACLGSPCVVAVEGSSLAHGLMTVRESGALVALQPPWRFNNVYKDRADCLGLRYGFVVGARSEPGFRIDPDELERTLDLCEIA